MQTKSRPSFQPGSGEVLRAFWPPNTKNREEESPVIEDLKKELENELKSQTHEDGFKKLKEKHQTLEPFRTPQELVGFLSPGGDHDEKDGALSILIKEYGGETPSRVAGTILILTFFPVIKNIYFRRSAGSQDNEELIGALQCCFLEAARNYPLDKRPCKIAANLKFLTIRAFLDSQTQISEADDAQKLILDEAEKYRPDAEQLSEAYPGIAPAAVADRESIEMTVRNYRVFVDAGVVSQDDFMLIVETRLLDRDIRDVSNEMGIGIETAWKRRKRAEQAIKEHFQKYF